MGPPRGPEAVHGEGDVVVEPRPRQGPLGEVPGVEEGHVAGVDPAVVDERQEVAVILTRRARARDEDGLGGVLPGAGRDGLRGAAVVVHLGELVRRLEPVLR